MSTGAPPFQGALITSSNIAAYMGPAQNVLSAQYAGGAVPGQDCSAAVLAAIAASPGPDATLYFPQAPAPYLLRLGQIGAAGAGNGKKIRIIGDHPTLSLIGPLAGNTTDPLFTISGNGDASDDWFDLLDVGLVCPTPRPLGNPLIQLNWARNFRIRARADVSASICTLLSLESSYQGHFEVDFRTGRHSVGIEITNQQNTPSLGVVAQADSYRFDGSAFTGCYGVVMRNAQKEEHGIGLRNAKFVQTSQYPTTPGGETTLAANGNPGDGTVQATPAATLSALLSTGAPITTLPISALMLGGTTASSPGTGQLTLPTGSVITVDDGAGHTQQWTLSAPAGVGAISLAVVSQTPNFAYPAGTSIIPPAQYWIVAGDTIAIGMETLGESVDYCKVQSIATGAGAPFTITLDPNTPLRFAHTTGAAILVGGIAVSIGDGVHDVSSSGHFEGHQVGLALGAVQEITWQSLYCGVGTLIRVNGNVQKIRGNGLNQRGSNIQNVLLRRSPQCTAAFDGDWIARGNYTGAAVVPAIGFPHTTRNWVYEGIGASAVANEIANADVSAAGSHRFEFLTGNAVRGYLTYGGFAKLGVMTVYVAGAGKTTAADADWQTAGGGGNTFVPSDGAIEVTFDTTAAKTYLHVRANGTWHVMAGPI